MTTISSVSSAWSSASVQRASRPAPTPERLLSKIDTDGNGGVSDTELQGLLDDVAQKTGVSNQASAADLVKQYDSNGDGNLNADELGKTMQSVLPPPPSTMAFAQSRGDSDTATGQAGDDLFGKVDSDGDGAVSKTELQALLEAMSGGTASQAGVSSDDVFSQLDADGDGSLTQAEFDAGRPSGAAGEAGGGMQAMGGIAQAAQPNLWQPYGAAHAEVLHESRPAALLKQRFAEQAETIDHAVAQTGLPIERLRTLPLLARKAVWTVLIDSETAQPVGYIPVDPF